MYEDKYIHFTQNCITSTYLSTYPYLYRTYSYGSGITSNAIARHTHAQVSQELICPFILNREKERENDDEKTVGIKDRTPSIISPQFY
jgi:hypothetical protein